MRRLLVLAPLVAAPLLAQAPAAKRPMTPDDVMALKSVSDAQISPDGRWVAYVVTTPDFKENAQDANVWLVGATCRSVALGPVAPGCEPVQLTRSVKADNAPRWSPDGKRLAFLSNREENRNQLWVINPFGGEPERLTESKTGIGAFQWSPDGARIAYVATQEPTPEEEKRTKEKDDPQVFDRDFRMSRLWVLDVATRKATETQPRWVFTSVRSATHTRVGPSARNWRATRSAGPSLTSSRWVVRTLRRPRTTPCRPSSRMRRSTVQRATRTPSRFNCAQTLSAP